MAERDSKPNGWTVSFRVSEEIAWKVVRWAMTAVFVFFVQYAPRAVDYFRELNALPELRASINRLDVSLREQVAVTARLQTSLTDRAELDVFLFGRMVSLEAADREPRAALKAAAASHAVGVYEQQIAKHRTPLEALETARYARLDR